MYVCLCNGVTDGEIRAAVDEGAASLVDLQSRLPVAVCCGCCADTARDIVDEHLRTRASPGIR